VQSPKDARRLRARFRSEGTANSRTRLPYAAWHSWTNSRIHLRGRRRRHGDTALLDGGAGEVGDDRRRGGVVRRGRQWVEGREAEGPTMIWSRVRRVVPGVLAANSDSSWNPGTE